MKMSLITLTVGLATLLISQPGSMADEIAGISEPFHDVTMSSPVNGIIGARLVEEGTFVRKGEVLIELDNGLEALDVSRKKYAKEMAASELQRLKALADKNAISVSREEVEHKQTEFNIAAVDLDFAKEQLRKRSLVSPIDGYVTEIFLEVGEGCEPRQPIIRLVETRRCYFVTNLDAKLGHSLSPGQKLSLTVDAGASQVKVEGTVSFVSPVIDPASSLMKVKLSFENPNGNIRPGAAGRLLIAK
jgi:RND family efflux transporter MFP subunit